MYKLTGTKKFITNVIALTGLIFVTSLIIAFIILAFKNGISEF